MTADAVVFTQPNVVEFRRVEVPDPGPTDVVVRVTQSWISNGTEGSYLRGERIGGDRAFRPGDPIPFPIVPGYQKIGVVKSVGADVSGFRVGQSVFAALGQVKGMAKPIAGHISPSVCKLDQVWPLPEGQDSLAFAGMVLTQVGYNCGTRAPITSGEPALVIGDGQVGQWTAQTLAWRGAKVLMVGRRRQRLELAKRLTSCSVHDARDTPWEPSARAFAPDGFAVAVDAVGSPAATETVMSMMRHGGHIVSAGFCGTQDLVSLQNLRGRELSIDSVSGWTRPRMDETLKLIAEGHLKTLPLITHQFPVEKAAEAWKLIGSAGAGVMGVILNWR
jgi:2-desacetyl-2-hydroxyethyl bacteriochlorophyllide A dehydrogenase